MDDRVRQLYIGEPICHEEVHQIKNTYKYVTYNILYFYNQLSCIFNEITLQWPTYQMSGRNDEPKSWFWIKIKSRKGPMCKVRGLKFIKVMLHGFRTIHILHKHIFRLLGISSPCISIFSGSKNCHFPTHLPLQVLT